MNRKEMQQWLEQFPEDAEIHVGIQQSAPSYCPYGEVVYEKFKGERFDDYDYMDFNGNTWIEVDSLYYNRRILELGGRE
jgi:hypothetical protein